MFIFASKRVNMIKKIAFCLFFLLNTTLMLAQDLNDYLLDRLTASWQCRQVDYEDMIDVVLKNTDSLDSYLRGLAFVEIMRSEGNDSMTIKMIDKLFELYNDSRIAGMRDYLLDTKKRLLLLDNRYNEISEMANYVGKRWPDDADMQQWVIRHKRLADAAKDIKPVIPEGDNTTEIVAQVGEQNLEIAAGMYSHPLVQEHDAIGFWGLPILWALDRICLDFKHTHVDFIRRKGVSNTLRLASKNN